MTICNCVVIAHPAGPVWVALTQDRTCPHHTHGQRWTDTTRGA